MDRYAELNAFCAVVACGGFSAAGRKLGLATSSVTRLVDSLETRLGAVLLNRSTRSVTLTDAGRLYHERALRLLEDWQAADDEAGARGGAPQGLLRVAAPVTFSTMHIAPLLPELAQRYPGLQLDLRLSESYSNMVDESIDVAIRIGSPDMPPSLIARHLAAQERVICASPAYLARNGTPRAPADLATHNCLQFAYGDGRHVWRLQASAPPDGPAPGPHAGDVANITVHGSLSVNNGEVLRQAALSGMGLVLLADWLVGDDLASGALLRVLPGYRVNPGAMDIGVYAVYPANRRGSTRIKTFIDMLAGALAKRAGTGRLDP